MKKGLLIILSGPSGVGKKTLWSSFINDKSLDLVFSISMTTRKQRPGEIDKKDYFFLTKEEFKKNIDNGKLLEWATYVDNYYGTPKDFVEQQRNNGKNVLLEIEPQGALKVMDYFRKIKDDKILTVFISPKSFDALKERLAKRQTENDSIINQRIEQSKWELTTSKYYQHTIINDNLAIASSQLYKIIKDAINKNK